MAKRITINQNNIFLAQPQYPLITAPSLISLKTYRFRHTVAQIFQCFTYWPTLWLLKLTVKFEVTGKENVLELVDKRSIIFASNHATFIDGPMCAAALPRLKGEWFPKRFMPMRFLVMKEYFGWINPVIFPLGIPIAAYVRVNGSICVQKSGGDLYKALGEAIDTLNKGASLCIYPEGKLTKDGELNRGKKGVAFLQQQTGAPIIPIGIEGHFKAFKLKNIFTRRSKVTLHLGKAFYIPHNLSLEQGADYTMKEIAKLVKKEYNPKDNYSIPKE